MTTATGQAIHCPQWCRHEHTEAEVNADGFALHHVRVAEGTATTESGKGERWFVDVSGSDDDWAGVFVEGGDNGMTAAQARAMAQALMEAAERLDSAS